MKNSKSLAFKFNNEIYRFTPPRWWNNIKIDLNNIEFSDGFTISEFCENNYGADAGTKKTWRKALKAHALHDLSNNELPIYIAHCASVGGDHEFASKIYTELFQFIQFFDDYEDKDWHHTYLAFEAGGEYESLKQYTLATIWYKKSMKFLNSKENSVKYYAEQSKIRFDALSQRGI